MKTIEMTRLRLIVILMSRLSSEDLERLRRMTKVALHARSYGMSGQRLSRWLLREFRAVL